MRVIVDGEISYHTYRKDGEQSDRREAEIHVKGDGGLNFIDGDKAD